MNAEAMIRVLEDAKALLSREGNDFAWSSFRDRESAVAEIDDHIARIRKNDRTKRIDLSVLFTVTGPIQEVSLSSGWADDFLVLAEKFDRAEAE